jgi:hypothetical protein
VRKSAGVSANKVTEQARRAIPADSHLEKVERGEEVMERGPCIAVSYGKR